MSDQDMFNTTPKETTPEVTPPAQPNPFDDKLKAITNEDGEPKYKDVDTALEALKASQQFIEQLKAEKAEETRKNEEARAELERLGNIESFVERVTKNAKPAEVVETPPTNSGLSEAEIAELVQKQLQQRDTQSQQEKNLEQVVKHLSETHGDKAPEFLKQRATELGTTVDQLKELSRSNPKLAMAAFGSVAKAPSTAPSQSSFTLSPKPSEDNPAPKWEKGATSGGLTDRELAERFRQSKEYTNKRIGLET